MTRTGKRNRPGDPLTPRQAEVLAAIRSHWREHGVPPTLRELCGPLGIRSPVGVICHLKSLAAKGVVEWTPTAPGMSQQSRRIGLPEVSKAIRAALAEHPAPVPRGAVEVRDDSEV